MTILEKPITRKTRRNFMHYRKPLVVALIPGDLISLREHRCKRTVYLDLHSLYIEGLRRQILAEKREKKKARKRRP
jgi:hypothetical protein